MNLLLRRESVIFLFWSSLILLAFAAAYPAYQAFKNWRGEALIAEAQTLFNAGKKIEALRKASSAHHLNPQNTDCWLILAKAGGAVYHPDSLKWWKRSIHLPEITKEDIFTYFKLAMEMKQYPVADQVLTNFSAKLPTHSESLELQVDLLLKQKRHGTALDLLRSHLETDNASWSLHEHFLSEVQRIEGEAGTQIAEKHLLQLAQNQSEIGLQALRRLLANPDFKNNAELWATYLNHPQRENKDLLAYSTYSVSRGLSDLPATLAHLKNTLDLENDADAAALASWLIENKAYTHVLEQFDDYTARRHPDTFRAYLTALLETGDFAQATYQTLVSKSENPLSEAENLVFRARAQKQLGKADEYFRTLELAAQVSELSDLAVLEPALIEGNRADLQKLFYERMIADKAHHLSGMAKLITFHYREGNEQALVDLMSAWNPDKNSGFKISPELQSYLIYLELLYQQRMTENRETLEQLATEYTTVADFRILLAFAYARSNQAPLALALLNNFTLPPERELSSNTKIAWAYVLSQGGQKEKAQQILAGINQTMLLPQEKLLIRPLKQLPL